jgi:hypothetical protein
VLQSRTIPFIVTGCLPTILRAEIFIRTLNQSVVFFKDREITLTNNVWRIVINLNMNPYAEALATIREDLQMVEKQKTEFTPLSN